MQFTIALLVFVVVTVAVFAAMSLFDQRKAQARVLHDRLSTVQEPAEQPPPDAALLRDEVLSRIPAFDTFLRRSDRVSQLQKMLAQGTVDVRAGHFLTTALEMIANEVTEPVAGEFRQLFEEQKFGLPVRDALLNLADRIPLVDVKFFVTAVMLQRETGGNLAEILDNLS